MSTSELEGFEEQESSELLPKNREVKRHSASQAHQQNMEDQDQDQHSGSPVSEMDSRTFVKEFISVWVRDPQLHREEFWHAHIDYEICLHSNSMCFQKKTSCVRRRYSEFVWLRQRLQENAVLIELPKLPPWNPFFSLSNEAQISQRMQGLQQFLQAVLETPFLLSDSRLHLFLQSQLSTAKIDACAQGQTRYTVAQAIHRCPCDTRFPIEEQRREEDSKTWDSDCESTASSGLGHSVGPSTPVEDDSYNDTTCEAELFSSLSSSSCTQ